VPSIIARGAEWFRNDGTAESGHERASVDLLQGYLEGSGLDGVELAALHRLLVAARLAELVIRVRSRVDHMPKSWPAVNPKPSSAFSKKNCLPGTPDTDYLETAGDL